MPAANGAGSGVPAGDVLALDVGEARIGVARASLLARLPEPLTTLDARAADVIQRLADLCKTHAATVVVVGLPRGLSGQDTPQTEYCREFAHQLEKSLALPVELQDEALSSQRAEADLRGRGQPYDKADIDALAACYILQDYLHSAA